MTHRPQASKPIHRYSPAARWEAARRAIDGAPWVRVKYAWNRDKHDVRELVGVPVGLAPSSTGVASDVVVLRIERGGLRALSLATVVSIDRVGPDEAREAGLR